MAALTEAQLLVLRREYLRDEAVLPAGATSARYLSRYNKAEKADYFTDADLRSIDDRVDALWGVDLTTLRENAYGINIDAGLDETTAAAKADRAQLDARFRLIRAEAWTMMIADPMYRASLMVGDDSGTMTALLDAWKGQIETDRAAATPSGTGGIVSIPLARK